MKCIRRNGRGWWLRAREIAHQLGLILPRAAALAAVLATSALAQETVPDFYKEPGLQPNRQYVHQHVTEHVDPFTGSLQIHSVDVHLPGNGGLDLNVVRSFNSSRIDPVNLADAGTSSLVGVGWTLHFGRVLKRRDGNPCVNTDGGTAIGDNPVVELPDGSRQVLVFTPNGSPLMLTTQRWRADCLGGGTGLAVYSPDGVRYDMTQQVQEVGGTVPVTAWYAKRITDRNDNWISIEYAGGATPQISRVSASDGRLLVFNYADSGLWSRRISTITSGSRTWTYAYQSAGGGSSGVYQLRSVTPPDAGGAAWQYAYNGDLGADNAGNHQLLQLTYPQGGNLRYGYGHVHFDAVTNPASRSVVVASKTSSDGGAWSFAYSPGAVGDYDTTTVGTPTGTVVYRHVGANHALSGSVWRIGLLVQKTLGTLQTETYEWGSQKISDENNLRQGAFPSRIDTAVQAPILLSRRIVRDGIAYQTTYANHDDFGNPKTVTEAGPNGGSRSTSLTYAIDTARWIVRQVDDETTAGVGTVIRSWDDHGNLATETRDGVMTRYAYHPSGDLQVITRPRGLVSSFGSYHRGIARSESHPEGVSISREVSDAGNLVSETNGEGRTTGYGHDGQNRLTRIGPPSGNATAIAHTATTRTASRGSLQQVSLTDGFGRTTSVTTGGQAVVTRYDSLGRKTFVSLVGFPLVGHSFTYDGLNRPLRITHSADGSYRTFTYGASGGVPTMAVRDERGLTTTHAYRAYGDPEGALLMATTPPVAVAATTLTRNGRGLVTSVTQAGLVRRFNYDSRYFLTSTEHPEVGSTSYGRDEAGNMTTRQVGSSGVARYEYDGRNRLWRVTWPGGAPAQTVNVYLRTDKLRSVTQGGTARRYDYDANQNLVGETLEVDGLTLAATYEHNANDQLSAIVYPVLGHRTELRPDVLGRPREVSVPAGSMFGASYWPNGQLYDVAYAGGSRVTYGMNTREWLSAVTVRTGDGAARVASTLAFDVAGNLYNVADSVDASFNRSFAYDGMNRLTTANGPWGSGQVSYGGSGNITSHVLGAMRSTAYQYDGANRLVSTTAQEASGTQTTTYDHDAHGNALPAVGGVAQGYAYDAAGNLLAAGGQSFAYDGLNTRVKTVRGAATTYEFRSAQGLLLAELRREAGSYDRLQEYIHLAGRPVAQQQTDFIGNDVRPTGWMFMHGDSNGTPIAATWSSGGLLYKESFQPYGSPMDAIGSGFSPLGLAGKKQDAADLVYMGGRYYNPQVGRFLSIDPKEADPADPRSLNRYAYANNNPYRFVDPDGRSPVDVAFLAYDVAQLGLALYNGGDVGGAAIDVGLSAIGVIIPVPGSGQAMKAVRVADKAVQGVSAAEHVGQAAAKGESLVYRAASGTPSSMTPRTVDLKGLSAADSLAHAMPGKNQVIDTSKFKSLCAVCDNPATGHVSIMPKDMSQMQDWINSRGGTEIHPLTRELMDAVVGTVKK